MDQVRCGATAATIVSRDGTAGNSGMAPRINELAVELRERGVLVVHAPSETMDFYRDHQARELSVDAVQATEELSIGMPV